MLGHATRTNLEWYVQICACT